MKQIILFCLLLLPFCLSAQILETFDGPDYNSANPWRSDSVGFYLQAGQLCFDASGRTKGVHYIKLDIPYANNMEWEFDVSFQYVPTAANHARAYVYATGMPDNQLFYIQIGRKDKSIQLIRLDRDDIETILIKGRSNLFSTINTTVRVRLQLKNESEWILYSRTMSESNYTKEAKITLL